jgi:hypothetical protein
MNYEKFKQIIDLQISHNKRSDELYALKIDLLDSFNEIIRVTNYNNPKYHELANKFIKELGIKQPLFQEIGSVPALAVCASAPRPAARQRLRVVSGLVLSVQAPRSGVWTRQRRLRQWRRRCTSGAHLRLRGAALCRLARAP